MEWLSAARGVLMSQLVEMGKERRETNGQVQAPSAE